MDGGNTAREKKPFHISRKIRKDHHPHTGQIATSSDMTAIKPTTAPMGTNFGLYSSMFFVSDILGMMKDANIIRQKMRV